MYYEGTLVGLKKRSAVVMTGDCQFKEIRRTPAMVGGQKICFTEADLVKPAFSPPLRVAAIAASLLFCFVLAYSLLQGFMDRRAFACISLEVNPSLDISLDREMKVLKVTGLNEDGREIAGEIKLRGLTAAEAVQAVLSLCVERGYLNGDHNRVLLATTLFVKNDPLQEDLDYRIWDAARRVVPEGTALYILNADPALRAQAVEKGVSTGRYLLWQDARNSGQPCDLDGPLSGPAFSRSAAKLSVPFTEKKDTAPGPAPSPTESDSAIYYHSSAPAAATAPGSDDNRFGSRLTSPGLSEGIDYSREKNSGSQDNTGGNGQAGFGQTGTNGGFIPAPGVGDDSQTPVPPKPQNDITGTGTTPSGSVTDKETGNSPAPGDSIGSGSGNGGSPSVGSSSDADGGGSSVSGGNNSPGSGGGSSSGSGGGSGGHSSGGSSGGSGGKGGRR